MKFVFAGNGKQSPPFDLFDPNLDLKPLEDFFDTLNDQECEILKHNTSMLMKAFKQCIEERQLKQNI